MNIIFIFCHRSLEVQALFKAASHMAVNLPVSVISHVDSLAAKLLMEIFTLLLEVLSITVKFTMMAQHDPNSMRIQKDELIKALRFKVNLWIEKIMSKTVWYGSCNPFVFGAGLRSGMFFEVNRSEEFVDLYQEFKVQDDFMFVLIVV